MQERIERPILFSTDMVKAILADRKTMTRVLSTTGRPAELKEKEVSHG